VIILVELGADADLCFYRLSRLHKSYSWPSCDSLPPIDSWRIANHPFGNGSVAKHWEEKDAVAGYRARFSEVLDSEETHPCWRGWEEADRNRLEGCGTIESLQGAGKTSTRTAVGRSLSRRYLSAPNVSAVLAMLGLSVSGL
jgi:hypothetical protein